MALQGNLQDFTVTQLLNLVNLANKSGALLVQSASEGVRLVFREGKLAYAQLASDTNGTQGRLPEVLRRAGKINEAQIGSLRSRAEGLNDKELGLLLINSGFVTENDILDSLQSYYASLAQQLFTWVDGSFRFDAEQDVPENKIQVRMDLEDLIIEASRQFAEREQLTDEIPSLDVALALSDRPGINLKKINLNVEEWRVVSYINPKNSLRQIAKASKMTDLEIRRIVYGLLQAGLVKLAPLEGAPAQLDQATSAKKQVAKPLITRLMNRIRSG